MLKRLTRWEITIIHLGIFLLFFVTFASYVFGIWPIINPLFGRCSCTPDGKQPLRS